MNSDPNSSTTSPNSNHDGQQVRRKRKLPLNLQNCTVCGDEAYTDKFGVPTCSPCVKFIKRIAVQPKPRLCKFNGKCEITIEKRSKCTWCRLAKCRAVGMEMKAEQSKINIPTCKVCGDQASRVPACTACMKSFEQNFSVAESLPGGTSTSVNPAAISLWSDRYYKQPGTSTEDQISFEMPEAHFAQTTVSAVPSPTYEQSMFEPETFHLRSLVSRVPYDDQMDFQTSETTPPENRMSMPTDPATISLFVEPHREQSMPPVDTASLPKHKTPECKICGQQTSLIKTLETTVCQPCYRFFRNRLWGRTLVDRDCTFHGNCQINQENRTKCSPCRYNKYSSLIMEITGEEPAPELTVSECEVCGQQGCTYISNRVKCCTACHSFFRSRFHKRRAPVKECKKSGRCEINPDNRNKCPACRYNKYLNLKMDRSNAESSSTGPSTSVSPAPLSSLADRYHEQPTSPLEMPEAPFPQTTVSPVPPPTYEQSMFEPETFHVPGPVSKVPYEDQMEFQISGTTPQENRMSTPINPTIMSLFDELHRDKSVPPKSGSPATISSSPVCHIKQPKPPSVDQIPFEMPEAHFPQTTVPPVPPPTYEQSIFEPETFHVRSLVSKVSYEDHMEFRNSGTTPQKNRMPTTPTTIPLFTEPYCDQSMPPTDMLSHPKNKIEKCEICGQHNGVTKKYGINGCPACHAFFKDRVLGKTRVDRNCIYDGNCQMNSENRTKCPPCRYNKYWSLMMDRSGGVSFSKLASSLKVTKCEICGQQGCTSKTYGVKSCCACHSFFKIRFKQKKTVEECKNSGSCEINVDSRTKCKACRYNKFMNLKTKREIQPPSVETLPSINSATTYHEQSISPIVEKTSSSNFCEVSDACHAQNTWTTSGSCQKPMMPCPQFYNQDGHLEQMEMDLGKSISVNEFYPNTGNMGYPITPNPLPPLFSAQGEEWNDKNREITNPEYQYCEQNEEYRQHDSECPDPKLDSPDKIQLDLHDDFDEEQDYYNQLLEEVCPDPEDIDQGMYPNDTCPTPETKNLENPFNCPPISPAKKDQSWNLQLDGLISPEKCYPITPDNMEYQKYSNQQFENVDPGMRQGS